MEKDNIIEKKNNKLATQEQEISRRQFIETKVQTYVKSLCTQNEKCKKFITDEVEDKQKAKMFLQKIQIVG